MSRGALGLPWGALVRMEHHLKPTLDLLDANAQSQSIPGDRGIVQTTTNPGNRDTIRM